MWEINVRCIGEMTVYGCKAHTQRERIKKKYRKRRH